MFTSRSIATPLGCFAFSLVFSAYARAGHSSGDGLCWCGRMCVESFDQRRQNSMVAEQVSRSQNGLQSNAESFLRNCFAKYETPLPCVCCSCCDCGLGRSASVVWKHSTANWVGFSDWRDRGRTRPRPSVIATRVHRVLPDDHNRRQAFLQVWLK
jgi:hypothetical protein